MGFLALLVGLNTFVLCSFFPYRYLFIFRFIEVKSTSRYLVTYLRRV